MGGIDRDNQIRPNTLALQNFRKRHGAEPTHGVADQDDRLRVFAIIINRLGRDQAADGELVDVAVMPASSSLSLKRSIPREKNGPSAPRNK